MRNRRGNIFLIGLMGAGKTTLGRMLAANFGKTFIDEDVEIERLQGRLIKDIFAREGENFFRDLEEHFLAETCQGENIVLATGGGAVLRAANRQVLRENGTVIYLYVPEETLRDRLMYATDNRPLLKAGDGDDLLKRLHDLYAVRDALYRETAHYVHDESSDESPYETLRQLIEDLHSQPDEHHD